MRASRVDAVGVKVISSPLTHISRIRMEEEKMRERTNGLLPDRGNELAGDVEPETRTEADDRIDLRALERPVVQHRRRDHAWRVEAGPEEQRRVRRDDAVHQCDHPALLLGVVRFLCASKLL